MHVLNETNGMTDDCGPHCGIMTAGAVTYSAHCPHCHGDK